MLWQRKFALEEEEEEEEEEAAVEDKEVIFPQE